MTTMLSQSMGPLRSDLARFKAERRFVDRRRVRMSPVIILASHTAYAILALSSDIEHPCQRIDRWEVRLPSQGPRADAMTSARSLQARRPRQYLTSETRYTEEGSDGKGLTKIIMG
jgi:hypothetical protein